MDSVPSSQPKPWRVDPSTGVADLLDEEEEGSSSGSHGDSGEAPGTEWRDGHRRAWSAAQRSVGFKAPRAAKRPRDLPASPVSEEADPELDSKVPAASIDLRIYFGRMPDEKQIAICRAYASYLSARRRGTASK